MKTILVGVDFTKSSNNTISYAVEIAKQSKSKILLFHALTAPAIHTTSGLVFMTGDEFAKDAGLQMKELQTHLSAKNKAVKFDIEITNSGIRDKVQQLASQNKISLVVLGLETKSKMSVFLNGTTSLDLTGKINCPIITISEKYKHHKIKKMLIAVDNKETISSALSKRIHSVIKFLGVDAEFVHIKTEYELEINQKVNKQITVTNIKANNIEEGITSYAKKSKADIVMLISNNYNAFYSLFVDHHSKKIILSSNIPVLSIHK